MASSNTKRGEEKTGTDVMSPAKRSEVMSRIRGKNTKPELLLRKALWRRGLRYRLKIGLPGRPDLVFPGERIAIFVDGCFWHGCPEHSTKPKQNAVFWETKLALNIARDRKVNALLAEQGWTVVRFWEHQVEKELDQCIEQLALLLGQKS